jgi:hypothetical protein
MPSPGDQGQVNSCSAWATAYTALGYWERRDDLPAPRGSEPMYTYSQTNRGQDSGSGIDANLDIAMSQGVDNRADYFQGRFRLVRSTQRQ